jgi:hypothetical protein
MAKTSTHSAAQPIIPSSSTVVDGDAQNSSSILAIDSPNYGSSDNSGEVINDRLSAQSARLSRRILIMNSIVSAAALSSAVAVASPVGDSAIGTDEDPELVKLGEQLDLVARQWVVQRAVDRKTPEDTDKAWDSIFDHLDPLVQLILARKARTKAGLAIQALAASIACQELWEDGNVNEEAPADVERIFIEAVCRYAGITPFPLDPSSFLTASVSPFDRP